MTRVADLVDEICQNALHFIIIDISFLQIPKTQLTCAELYFANSGSSKFYQLSRKELSQNYFIVKKPSFTPIQ